MDTHHWTDSWSVRQMDEHTQLHGGWRDRGVRGKKDSLETKEVEKVGEMGEIVGG